MFGIDYDTCTTIPKCATCPMCGSAYKQTTNIEKRSIVSIMILPSLSASPAASMSSSAAFRILLRGDQTKDVVLGSTVAGTGYHQPEGWDTVSLTNSIDAGLCCELQCLYATTSIPLLFGDIWLSVHSVSPLYLAARVRGCLFILHGQRNQHRLTSPVCMPTQPQIGEGRNTTDNLEACCGVQYHCCWWTPYFKCVRGRTVHHGSPGRCCQLCEVTVAP